VLVISKNVILSWWICVSPNNFTCLFLLIIGSIPWYRRSGHERCILNSVDKPFEVVEYILNIYSLLCHCIEKVAMNRMFFVNDVKQGIHSSTISTIVRPKAIFMHLGLFEFLLQLASLLLVSSFRAQWRGPLLRKLSIISFAVYHYCLISLDRIIAERLKLLEASTSKW
jgi:hypothetical protein